MRPVKQAIMVIDDHPIIHDGLKTLLSGEKDLEIVASALSAAEALDSLENTTPHLAIIDLSLGDSDGIYLIQRIKSKHAKLRILVYTMSEEKLFAERAALAGADGYVMKTSPPPVLKKAIRTLLAGETFFEPGTYERIQKKRMGRHPSPKSIFETLSNREMDIFTLVGQGLDSASIGEKLRISRNTVDTHRINIKNKLELPNSKAVDRLAYEVIKQGKLPEQ